MVLASASRSCKNDIGAFGCVALLGKTGDQRNLLTETVKYMATSCNTDQNKDFTVYSVYQGSFLMSSIPCIDFHKCHNFPVDFGAFELSFMYTKCYIIVYCLFHGQLAWVCADVVFYLLAHESRIY